MPVPATASEESVETLAFTYLDAERVAALEDELSDEAVQELPRNRTPPAVDQGTVDQLLRIQVPILDQELSSIGGPAQVYAGSFDPQTVVQSLQSAETEWGEQTEYGEFTVLARGGGGDRAGISLGVRESTMVYAREPGEATETIERVIDTGSGALDRAHEIDTEIARLYDHIDGSTFVSFRYGPELGDSGEASDDFAGFVIGVTLSETEADIRRVFVYTDESSASMALDGNLLLSEKTVPIGEFKGF